MQVDGAERELEGEREALRDVQRKLVEAMEGRRRAEAGREEEQKRARKAEEGKRLVASCPIVLRICYAVRGTELRLAGTRLRKWFNGWRRGRDAIRRAHLPAYPTAVICPCLTWYTVLPGTEGDAVTPGGSAEGSAGVSLRSEGLCLFTSEGCVSWRKGGCVCV